MTGLVFLHGWGYGPETWDQWAAAFPKRPVAVLDIGYFGPERMRLPDNPGGWIGVGHSLGFARLLSMDVPWRALVGFGAFLRFCAFPAREGGTPTETIDAMLTRLDADPADVLARFLRRCGQKGQCPAPPDELGIGRLRRDLEFLRDLDLRGQSISRQTPMLLLHAADDRIVAPVLAQEAQQQLSGARLTQLEAGGHALPFTRFRDCLALVREFLHGLP